MTTPRIARALRVLDYAVGAATLGYGLATLSPLFIGGGVAGLVLAHLNLSERISQQLRRYFGRKGKQVVPPAPELALPESTSETQEALPSPRQAHYGTTGLHVGAGLASSSRHSLFQRDAHTNHAGER